MSLDENHVVLLHGLHDRRHIDSVHRNNRIIVTKSRKSTLNLLFSLSFEFTCSHRHRRWTRPLDRRQPFVADHCRVAEAVPSKQQHQKHWRGLRIKSIAKLLSLLSPIRQLLQIRVELQTAALNEELCETGSIVLQALAVTKSRLHITQPKFSPKQLRQPCSCCQKTLKTNQKR